MLPESLVRLAKLAADSVPTRSVTLTTPDVPHILRKVVTGGCRAAAGGLLALAVLLSASSRAEEIAPEPPCTP